MAGYVKNDSGGYSINYEDLKMFKMKKRNKKLA